MAEVTRKRRKWDVAAPKGIPLTNDDAKVPGVPAGAPATVPTPASSVPHSQPPSQPAFHQQPPAMVIKPGQPLTSDVIAKAQQGAAAILAKINQELAAQGKLRSGAHLQGNTSEEKEIAREVTINDAPAEIRHHLTKRATQDEIARRTGTAIAVRGRYMPPGMADDTEKPLLLRVTPGRSATEDDAEKARTVAVAAALITDVLNGAKLPRVGLAYQPPAERATAGPAASGLPSTLYQAETPPIGASFGTGFGQPATASGPGAIGGLPPVRPGPPVPRPGVPAAPPAAGPSGGGRATKLWVGIEAPPDFQLAERLRGPGGAFLAHIASETRAAVALRGVETGQPGETEPLHISIVAPDPRSYDDAVRLAQNLIDTLRAEHAKTYPLQPQVQPPYAAPYSSPAPAAPPAQLPTSGPGPAHFPAPYARPSAAPYASSPITLPPPGAQQPGPYMPMPTPGPAPGPVHMPPYSSYAAGPPFQKGPHPYYGAGPLMPGMPQARQQPAPPPAALGTPQPGYSGPSQQRLAPSREGGRPNSYNAMPPPSSLQEAPQGELYMQAQTPSHPISQPAHSASVGSGAYRPAVGQSGHGPALPAYMQRYAAPPGTYRPPLSPGTAAAAPALGPGVDMQAAAEAQEQQRRKRFRENREAEAQAATHHTPQRAAYTEAYAGPAANRPALNGGPETMGPPPARAPQGQMGPPPPRFPQGNGAATGGMGPPAPRQPLHFAGGQGSDTASPLAALVDYGDDD